MESDDIPVWKVLLFMAILAVVFPAVWLAEKIAIRWFGKKKRRRRGREHKR